MMYSQSWGMSEAGGTFGKLGQSFTSKVPRHRSDGGGHATLPCGLGVSGRCLFFTVIFFDSATPRKGTFIGLVI